MNTHTDMKKSGTGLLTTDKFSLATIIVIALLISAVVLFVVGAVASNGVMIAVATLLVAVVLLCSGLVAML